MVTHQGDEQEEGEGKNFFVWKSQQSCEQRWEKAASRGRSNLDQSMAVFFPAWKSWLKAQFEFRPQIALCHWPWPIPVSVGFFQLAALRWSRSAFMIKPILSLIGGMKRCLRDGPEFHGILKNLLFWNPWNCLTWARCIQFWLQIHLSNLVNIGLYNLRSLFQPKLINGWW